MDYLTVSRAKGSCCDVNIHCASLNCVSSTCSGPTNNDAIVVTSSIPTNSNSTNQTVYLEIYETEQKYQTEYTPLTALWMRLIIVAIVVFVLSIVMLILNICAKKKGGWDRLCVCNKEEKPTAVAE